MQGVFVAPLAMLLFFQFLLRLFLVHKRDVVTALAFRTLQPNDVCHALSPHFVPCYDCEDKQFHKGDGTHRPKRPTQMM
jgi:hypothetical protein